MKLKKIILGMIIIPFLQSCNYFILTSGKVHYESSITEIPFEERHGLPIIKVSIKGEDYDFIFDTGATNVISKDLAEKLNLKHLAIQGIIDSQGNKSILYMVRMDTICINKIQFINTGATVADLNKSVSLSCLNIDGIIGTNLMRLAIFEIDYPKKKIRLTSSKNLLDIPNKANVLSFKTDLTGSQYINIELENINEKNVVFDTGSNGQISCSKKSYKKLLNNNPSIRYNFGFGNNSSGIFGIGKPDSVFYAQINQAKFGDLEIQNPIIQFQKKGSKTIGSGFFKDYRIIMDWKNKEITMVKTQDSKIDLINTFGFTVFLESNKLIVKYILNNSSADLQGIKLGDQIIKINDINYSKTEQKCYCNIIENGLFYDEDTISVTLLRNHQELNFNLYKKSFLEI